LTSVQLSPSPDTELTATFGFAEIAARYRFPLAPAARLPDVTVVDAVEPPVTDCSCCGAVGSQGVAVGVLVGVRLAVAVVDGVNVKVGVAEGVAVDVGVAVEVDVDDDGGVAVAVAVAVEVAVDVGDGTVAVAVAVDVGGDVEVEVAVGVRVGVGVAVGGTGVDVADAVAVAVVAGLAVAVDPAGGLISTATMAQSDVPDSVPLTATVPLVATTRSSTAAPAASPDEPWLTSAHSV
jgi:hypothetical protein